MRLKIFVMLILFCGVAMAQQGEPRQGRKDMKKERFERMEAIKIAYITKELNLTPEESAKFWPVYNKHHEKLKNLRESLRIANNEELTEAKADELITAFIEAEYEKARVHEEMATELKPIIGSVRVIQLTKVEHKFKREILSKAGQKRKQEMNERR